MRTGRPCEVCQSDNYRQKAQLDHRTKVYQCRRCRVCVVSPFPEREDSRDDFASLDFQKYMDYMAEFRRVQHRKDIEVIRRYRKEGDVLDIGSGPGFFLDEIRAAGPYRTTAVEPAKTAADYAAHHFGLHVINDEFENVTIGDDSFDIVSLFAVLEHTRHPRAVINRIFQILRRDGLFVVKVPRHDALIPFLIYASHTLSLGTISRPLRSLYDWDFQYPHLFHHSRKTILSLLESAGFAIRAVRAEGSINIKGFQSRLQLTAGHCHDDLRWARTRFARACIMAVLRLAEHVNLADDIVVYAQKP